MDPQADTRAGRHADSPCRVTLTGWGALRQATASWSATEEDVFRTLLALVLAAESGRPQITLATACSPTLTEASVASTTVRPEASLLDVAGTWQSSSVRIADGSPPDAVRRVLAVTRLPAASWGRTGDPRLAALQAAPLTAHATTVPEGLALALDSPSGHLDAAELAALADQLEGAARTLARDPLATVAQVVDELPPLRFEITLAGNADHDSLAPVLSYWGQAIGLPLRVRRAQLGELPPATATAAFPAPRPAGATVVVTRPDEWESRPARVLRPEPSRELPPGVRIGKLSNGAPIAEHDPSETRQLDRELLQDRGYLRHGLSIGDGAVVVDVGANIGLFGLLAHWEADEVRVHAVEPVAELADLLRANMVLYDVAATVHAVALGAASGTAELTYYPGSSLQSGVYADADADRAVRRRYLLNQVGARLGERADVGAAQLERELSAERRTVPRETLSDIIDREGLTRVDLLKVDAERSESDILAGIRPEHWARIRQLAVEVHDAPSELEELERTIAGHGFRVIAEQDDMFSGTGTVTLLASRSPMAERTSDAGRRTVATAVDAWSRNARTPLYAAVLPPRDGHARNGAAAALEADIAAAADVSVIDLSDAYQGSGDGSGARHAAIAGTELARRVTAPLRAPAKAIVVDADNTLWGGLCGERGPQGVALDRDRLALQRTLAEQRADGRLLCLCSRNNPEDVDRVFAERAEMELRKHDFAALAVGWGSKAESIVSIAHELGVALDSIVFLDDEPAERDEVRRRLPGVTVVDLPRDPAARADSVRATWSLAPDAELTSEDRLRASFAARARDREEIARTAMTFEEYLRLLEVDVAVAASSGADVERIAQLARRTTQFNTTLRRHRPADVRSLLAQSAEALTVAVEDRFGSYGTVGFVAARVEGGLAVVTDCFLSCRALGRNVEWAMLQTLAARMVAKRVEWLRFDTAEGERNRPARDFVTAAEAAYGGAKGLLDAARVAGIDWRAIAPGSAGPVTAAPAPVVSRSGHSRYRWPAPQAKSPSTVAQEVHHVAHRDRRLPSPRVAPRSPAERRVASAWRKVLGLESVGAHDDLLRLGGDSLAAVAICAELARAGNVLTLDAALDEPTVAGMAARLEAAATTSVTPDPGFDPGDRRATDGQRRVWAAERMTQTHGSQTIPLAYEIDGPLDVGRLEAAIEAVTIRHPALRTTLVDGRGGLLRHTSEERFRLREVELLAPDDARVARLGEQLLSEPFDLERDLMIRGLVAKCPDRRWVLLLAIHHSAADGWSVGLIQRDIGRLYASGASGHSNPADSQDFARYASRVRERERRGDYDDGARALLDGLGPPSPWTAPSDDPGGHAGEPRPRELRFDLPRSLEAAAGTASATAFALQLAALQLVLSSHTGRPTVTVGCPVANRSSPDHREIVGFLANIVPIALTVAWDGTCHDHLRASVDATRHALRLSDVPYGLLLRRRSGDDYRFDSPPLDALVTGQPPAGEPLRLTSCAVTPFDAPGIPLPFSLMVDFEERSDRSLVRVRYDASRFAALPLVLADMHATVAEALAGLGPLPLRSLRSAIEAAFDRANDASRARDQSRRDDWIRALRTGRGVRREAYEA